MKEIPVLIFGAGGVGQALLRQIVNGRSTIANRAECRFNVIAVADSQRWQWQKDGLSDAQLLRLIAAKENGEPVGEKRPSASQIIERAKAAGVDGAIIVDVTAVDGMEPMIDLALEFGYSVALANKKALAGPWESARAYFNHPRLRHESTVGGGQPIIATLRYLLDSNDPIYHIEGQLSGTLGFICQQLDNGVLFSQAIADAKTKGYTEPDPREDLGGQDVMRKILILGRMAGWPLQTEDVAVESLYPDEMATLSVEEFMKAAPQLDEAVGRRVVKARLNGNVLRFTAVFDNGRGAVGLQEIPRQSPLANMKYISFRTERYNDEALLIGGKGAGVEMTAAGVIGDMVNLARENL